MLLAADGKDVQHDRAGEAESLWELLKKSREQIQTGVFRAFGLESQQWDDGDLKGEVQIFCAFDFPGGRIRFDRSGPKIGSSVSQLGNAKKDAAGRWLRTREKSMWKLAGANSVLVHPPTTEPPWIAPFNVRLLGLAYWDGLHQQYDFDEILKAYNAATGVSGPTVGIETDDVHILTWRINGPYIRRRMWIDASKGYVPFRLEIRYWDGKPRDVGEPHYRCDVAYREVAGVWVPVSLAARNRPFPETTPVSSLDLAFEWESVNEPISDDFFTEESIGAVPGDKVVDFRLNAPIHIRRVRAPAPPPEPPGLANWRLVLIAANIVLISALFVVAWRWALNAAAILIVSGFGAPVLAADNATGAPDERAAEAEALWKLVMQSRVQLQSGMFRAIGREFQDWGRERPEGAVQIFCAFDFPGGRVRFDRKGPKTGVRPSSLPKVEDASGRWFRVREKTMRKLLDSEEIQVHAPTEAPPWFISPFNIQSVGLTYWRDLHKFIEIQDIYFGFSKANDNGPFMVQTESKDIEVLHWRINGPNISRRLWIDVAKGYAPLRIDVRYRQGKPLDEVEPHYRCDVAYREVAGVWVPVSLVADDRRFPRDFPVSKLELAFEWESVNEPIADDLFTEGSIGAVPGDKVVDFRLNAPIHIRRVRAPAPPPEPAGHINWRAVLIALNVVLISALVVVVAWRWHRRLRGKRR